MSELISVIVPVYNVEQYLPRCLNSIINQSYKDIEIILIDDGSTDMSATICDEYEQEHDNVFVYHIKNAGVSHARNMGIKHAHGDYIAFCDADDYIHPDMYSILYYNLIKSNADISSCRYKWVYDDKGYENNEVEKVIELEGRMRLKSILQGGVSIVVDSLYKKKIMENIRFEKLSVGEDAVFLVSVFSKNKQISIIESNQILYYWFQRKDSARTSGFSAYKLTALDAADRIKDIVSKNMPEWEPLSLVLRIKYYIGILSQIYASKNEDNYKECVIRIKKQLKEDMRNADRKYIPPYVKCAYFALQFFPKVYGYFALKHYRKVLGWTV